MITTKPMVHQSDIVEFCANVKFKDKRNYAGIFADYGTGKTLVALMLTELLKFKKVLIVSTKTSIDTTWCDQIREHSDFRFCLLRGTAKQKVNLLEYALGKVRNPYRYGYEGESRRPMLFLINYESVKSIYKELQLAEFDAIIADESTKIKTFNSERTLSLYEISDYIPDVQHRYIMTGFPVTEALFELYSQIKFLDRGKTFGNSYYAFLNKYFLRQGPRTIIKKTSIKKILDAIKPFCIRVTNEKMKLPPKRNQTLEVEMTDQQRTLLLELNNKFKLEFGNVKIDTQYIFTLLAKSLEICDGFIQHKEKELDEEGNLTGKILNEYLEIVDTNKDELLIETLEEIDIRRNKVVIWAAFLFSINKIKRYLEKLRIPVLTLTGDTVDVNKTVQMFQKSTDYNVILCTQKKAAESVTLTSAKYAIYYSNMWSNDLRLNSEARIRRKGSEIHNSILYIDLVTKGTVEKKVVDCLLKKKSLIDELKNEFAAMKVST
jgi:SNF2 family DNA or RNA helicase